ncbi:N-formylmaleamate deformylase-like [Schistocerca gregaria]|uniref:N-formylmaleamate deformylase-like n=1 Tax=Schistocerca gregaria TaxID=7010 RepID=UPI00211ED867|nr:N-formylmaleamate deformylase-like [Schistocerca gregaria]
MGEGSSNDSSGGTTGPLRTPCLTQSGYHSVKDGTKIYYELHGTGEHKVVLVAGFVTTALTWRQLAPFLAQYPVDGGFQVVCMDNRGCGRSDRPSGRYSTTLLASDVYSLLKSRLHLEKYHLLGHSMGGMIAQELALMDTQSILSLTLYSTHAGGTRGIIPLGASKLFYHYYKPRSTVEQVSDAILGLQFPSKYLSGACPISPYKTWGEYQKKMLLEDLECGHGYKTVCASGQLFAAFGHRVTRSRLNSLRESLLNNRAPILVINGSTDDFIRTSNSQYLSEVLQCPLKIIDGCGHMSHLQDFDRFSEVFVEHLNEAIRKHGSEPEADKTAEKSDDIL